MDQEILLNDANNSIEHYTELLRNKRQLLNINLAFKKDLLKFSPDADVSAFQNAEEMLHFNSLLNIAILELHVVSKHILLSTKPWERVYFLKQVYALIHETILVYNKHNKMLRDLTLKHTSLSPKFSDTNTELNNFKRAFGYPKEFLFYRNSIVAHIDSNLGVYYDNVFSIKTDQVLKILSSFIRILNSLALLSVDIEKAENDYLKKNNPYSKFDMDILKTKMDDLRNLINDSNRF